METCIKGIIFRSESKDYYVLPEGKEDQIRCSLRGKFKKDFRLKKDKLYKTGIAVVGDLINFELAKDGTGAIDFIEERKNYISRKAPLAQGASYRGERLEQVIASNIDNLFIITSIVKPEFNNKTIDRLIVAGESSHLNIVIIINKIDLGDQETIAEWSNLYSDVGYRTILTSKYTGDGFSEINKLITGKRNLFWGQSGVGKSTILNYLFPGINLITGEISNATNKGKHTTVTSLMLKMKDDTYIIDTPGIREIDPFGIRKKDLGHYFIEFAKFIKECRFNTCTHDHEPGCAVIEAVEQNKISEKRYDSYLRMLESTEEDIFF